MAIRAVAQNGRVMFVSFKHSQAEVATGKNRGKLKRVTTCFLSEPGEGAGPDGRPNRVVLGEGTSVCSFQDRFSKEAGRRISLERARVQAGFDEKSPEWHAIWSAYVNRPRFDQQKEPKANG